jgi:hypothetical protein
MIRLLYAPVSSVMRSPLPASAPGLGSPRSVSSAPRPSAMACLEAVAPPRRRMQRT